MEILHIVNDYFGTQLYSLLFQALYRHGVENEIFVPVRHKDCASNITYNRHSEGNIIVSPCFNTIDRFTYFGKQNNIVKHIIGLIELNKIFVTHAHTLFSSGYAAMKLKEKYGIPYVVAVRNVDVNLFFKKIIWLRSVGIKIMHNAGRIIFLSPSYQEFVNEKYVPLKIRESIRKKSVVIPNGISKLFLINKGYTKEMEDNKIRLIYVGEINRNKNLGITINAAQILKKQGIDISITCVGDVTENSCRKWINSELVKYFPKCSQADLLQHYREADIFVMPSHTETFGLVYAEAMSQGLPVIYTRGQGFDGHFPDGTVGYAVADDDAQEIASRILDISSNYKIMSKNCLCCVERFDWTGIASKYLTLYSEIISK